MKLRLQHHAIQVPLWLATVREILVISAWIGVGIAVLWACDRAAILHTQQPWSPMQAAEVDFPRVYQMWRHQEAVFVDARPPRAFLAGHIAGAVNVPVNRLSQTMHLLPEEADAKLIVYCSDPRCPNAYQLMRLLTAQGYRNVWLFPRGFRGWRALGYAAESEKP